MKITPGKILLAGGLVAGGVLGFRYLKKRREAAQGPIYAGSVPGAAPAPPLPASIVSTPRPSAPPTVQLNYNELLKRGSRGAMVKLVQRAANDIMRDVLKNPKRLDIDGAFGPATESVINILSGKKSITYNEMKALKKRMYIEKGLPDPYGTPSASNIFEAGINYFTS
jgi:hypothetical protein